MREFVGLAVVARYLGGCDFLLYVKVVEKKRNKSCCHWTCRQIMETLFRSGEKSKTLRKGRMPNTKGIRRDAKKRSSGCSMNKRKNKGVSKRSRGW
jgi:hypothetical protein